MAGGPWLSPERTKEQKKYIEKHAHKTVGLPENTRECFTGDKVRRAQIEHGEQERQIFEETNRDLRLVAAVFQS